MLVEDTHFCFRCNFLWFFDSDVDLAWVWIASNRFSLGFAPLYFLNVMSLLLPGDALLRAGLVKDHVWSGLLVLLLILLQLMLLLIWVEVVRLLLLLHWVLKHLVGEIEGAFLIDIVCLRALSDIDIPEAKHLVVALDLDLGFAVTSGDCRSISDFVGGVVVDKLLTLRRMH